MQHLLHKLYLRANSYTRLAGTPHAPLASPLLVSRSLLHANTIRSHTPSASPVPSTSLISSLSSFQNPSFPCGHTINEFILLLSILCSVLYLPSLSASHESQKICTSTTCTVSLPFHIRVSLPNIKESWTIPFSISTPGNSYPNSTSLKFMLYAYFSTLNYCFLFGNSYSALYCLWSSSPVHNLFSWYYSSYLFLFYCQVGLLSNLIYCPISCILFSWLLYMHYFVSS